MSLGQQQDKQSDNPFGINSANQGGDVIDLNNVQSDNNDQIDLNDIQSSDSNIIDLNDIQDSSNDQIDFQNKVSEKPKSFVDEFTDSMGRAFENTKADYEALFGSKAEALKIQQDAIKEYGEDPKTISSFAGNFVANMAPFLLAMIPGPQMPVVGALVLAHMGLESAGAGLIQAWDYEDKTGHKLSDVSKTAIAAGYGVATFAAMKVGLEGIKGTLGALENTAFEKIGAAFLKDDAVTTAKTLVKELGKTSLRTGGVFSLTSGAQKTLENSIQIMYDSRKDITDIVNGTSDAMVEGFGTGALAGLFGLGVKGGDVKGKTLPFQNVDESTPTGKLIKQLKEAKTDVTGEEVAFTMNHIEQYAEARGMTLEDYITKTKLQFRKGKNGDVIGLAEFDPKEDFNIPDFDASSGAADAAQLGKTLDKIPEKFYQVTEKIKDIDDKLAKLDQSDPDYLQKRVNLGFRRQLYREATEWFTETGFYEGGRNKDMFDHIDPLFETLDVKHGTSALFKKYSIEYIRSGEGNNAQGAGIYFSDLHGVGKYYADTAVKINRSKIKTDINAIGKRYGLTSEDKLFGLPASNIILSKIKTIIGDKSGADLKISLRGIIKGLKKDLADTSMRLSSEDEISRQKILKVLNDKNLVKILHDKLDGIRGRVLDTRIESKGDNFNWLNWYGFISENPTLVNIADDFGIDTRIDMKGHELYKIVAETLGSEVEASRYFFQEGIDGNKYPVGKQSGKVIKGKFNYVLFDPEAATILKTHLAETKGKKVLGSFSVEDSKRTITLFENADIKTILHETFHLFRNTLPEQLQSMADDLWNVKHGKKWSKRAEEEFVKDAMQYYENGFTANKRALPILRKFSLWLRDIYKTYRKSTNKKLSPEKYDFFEKLLDNRKIKEGSVVKTVGNETLKHLLFRVKDIDKEGFAKLEFLADPEAENIRIHMDRLKRNDTNKFNLDQQLEEAKMDAEKKGIIFADKPNTYTSIMFGLKNFISPERIFENKDPFVLDLSSRIIDSHLKYTFTKQDAYNAIDKIIHDVVTDTGLKKFEFKRQSKVDVLQKDITKAFWDIAKRRKTSQYQPAVKRAALQLHQFFTAYSDRLFETQMNELIKKVPGEIKNAFFEHVSTNNTNIEKLAHSHNLGGVDTKKLERYIKRYKDIKLNRLENKIPILEFGRYVIKDDSGTIVARAKSIKEARLIKKKYNDTKENVEIEKVEDWKTDTEGAKEYIRNNDNLFSFLPEYVNQLEKRISLFPELNDVKRDMATFKDQVDATSKEILNSQIGASIGQYTIGDQLLDGMLARLGDKNKFKKIFGNDPKAYQRIVSKIRKFEATTKLGYRPVAAFINGAAGYGHTYVAVGKDIMQQAADFLITPEGKKFISEEKAYTGVDFSIADTGEITTRIPLYKPLGMFQYFEPKIREHSLAANYIYAKDKLGITDDFQARRYARRALRFQNFTYNLPALPRLLRSPTAQLLGQFKTYLVKEMEFMKTLKGSEIARYISMQAVLGGPRGIVYTMKTLPFLASLGILDSVEEWLNNDKSGLTRGVGGLAGADITGPATFQFPQDPIRDFSGPFLSDLIKLFTGVLEPLMKGEGYIIPKNKRDFIVGTRSIDWLKGLSPIAYYWDDLISSHLSNDGWVYDKGGYKSYKLNGWDDDLKLILGAAPIQKSQIRVLERIQRDEDERNKKRKSQGMKRLIRGLKLYGDFDQKDLQDLIDLGLTPQGIVSRIKMSTLTPQQRAIAKSILIKKPEAFERFLNN